MLCNTVYNKLFIDYKYVTSLVVKSFMALLSGLNTFKSIKVNVVGIL